MGNPNTAPRRATDVTTTPPRTREGLALIDIGVQLTLDELGDDYLAPGCLTTAAALSLVGVAGC